MDADKQEGFMRLVIHQFHEKTRKVRATQKGRMRLSPADWEAYCNYACVFGAVKNEAQKLSSKKADCLENLDKAFLALNLDHKLNRDQSESES